MTAQTTELVVNKSITLACAPERAFVTFTEGIASWWPLATHSLGKERALTAVMEGRVGGRLYEVWDDGTERPWGTLVDWDPPRRVAISWKVNPDAAAPTDLEVRFEPEGDGTRVELEHRGWARLGAQGAEAHANYHGGWDVVLGAYAERAAA